MLVAVGCLVPSQALAAPTGTTVYVSAQSGSDAADGSAEHPLRTLGAALSAAAPGDTIELAEGTYREGELFVDKSVTIRAAQGASPVLSGATVPTSWTPSQGGTWSTATDMVRFCTVCTVNANPAVEGMAAHPEQVFVDGVPLTQVASPDQVTASSFYVQDPDPVTLKDPTNNRAGYNVKPHTGTAYVIGVDPAAHTVEVVQHSRAMSVAADGTTLSGLVVEKYAPVAQWDYPDPEIGTASGGAMLVTSANAVRVENSVFRYSSGATALGITSAAGATVTGNRFEHNGAGGFGVVDSSDVTVEHNTWTDNNTDGFNTTSCGAYCTIADMKMTHSQRLRVAFNTVDYSFTGVDVSDPSQESRDQHGAIWFDEGIMDSQIVGNNLVNVPVGIFNEVSSNTTIASNLVNGARTGIHISGSNDTKVWNNTVSHALTSVMIQEDSRSKGCNARRPDGVCVAVEPWSTNHGLSWDTTGTSVVNNIFSSEQTIPAPGDVWRYSAMIQVTGGTNDDGSGSVYANEMVRLIDNNVYYRPVDTGLPSTTVLWNWGADLANQSINASSLADFTASPHVTAEGKEASGLDLHGDGAGNPLFVSEPVQTTAWGTADLHLKDGSPASGTGRPLPQDVAQVVGLPAGTAVDRGVLSNEAWQPAAQPAPAPQPTPEPQAQPTSQQPAPAPVVTPAAAQPAVLSGSTPTAAVAQAPVQAPRGRTPVWIPVAVGLGLAALVVTGLLLGRPLLARLRGTAPGGSA